MARSDTRDALSVSVALLLPETGSVVPSGAVTVAVLTKLPVADDTAVPMTVKMTALPAPAAMLTVAARLLPEPLLPLLTEAAPVVEDVQLTPVRVLAMLSASPALFRLLGPLLVTVMV